VVLYLPLSSASHSTIATIITRNFIRGCSYPYQLHILNSFCLVFLIWIILFHDLYCAKIPHMVQGPSFGANSLLLCCQNSYSICPSQSNAHRPFSLQGSCLFIRPVFDRVTNMRRYLKSNKSLPYLFRGLEGLRCSAGVI